jgi:hypothetical protein
MLVVGVHATGFSKSHGAKPTRLLALPDGASVCTPDVALHARMRHGGGITHHPSRVFPPGGWMLFIWQRRLHSSKLLQASGALEYTQFAQMCSSVTRVVAAQTHSHDTCCACHLNVTGLHLNMPRRTEVSARYAVLFNDELI